MYTHNAFVEIRAHLRDVNTRMSLEVIVGERLEVIVGERLEVIVGERIIRIMIGELVKLDVH